MIYRLNWTSPSCWITKRCNSPKFPYELAKSPNHQDPSVSSIIGEIPEEIAGFFRGGDVSIKTALCTSCVHIHLPSLTLRLAHLQGDAVPPWLDPKADQSKRGKWTSNPGSQTSQQVCVCLGCLCWRAVYRPTKVTFCCCRTARQFEVLHVC